MKKLALLLLAATVGCLIHFGTASSQDDQEQNTSNSSILQSWEKRSSFLPPVHHNAYGPGVHSDAAGQAFQYQTQNGQIVPGFVKVKPDAFGPGVGMDQFGNTVKPKRY